MKSINYKQSDNADFIQDDFYAHIVIDTDGKALYQTVREHNEQTAQYAADCLKPIGLSSVGYLAGLLHDMGKYTVAYQQYLQKAVFEGDAVKGSVNHTFAGVRYMLTHYHDDEWGTYAKLTSEIIAYAIGAHHGQFDCVDSEYHSGFKHRMDKADISYDEAVHGYLKNCADRELLDSYFKKAMDEVEAVYQGLLSLLTNLEFQAEDSMFYVGLLSRLALSAVMEGDQRDTADFMGLQEACTEDVNENSRELWKKLACNVDKRIDEFPTDTKLNDARHRISIQCRDFGRHKSGVYKLNVPTGSGKTLSSLRYALTHAANYNKTRIIFTSPLLSILDQNAAIIRKYIDDDGIILEHHSNVIQDDNQSDGDKYRLLTASWKSPVIITTLVQLLNTMFSGKGSCIRRFHALCDSIIVIDEVQTVPTHLLSLFNLTIGFLSEICNATVLLCSATQPCSEAAEHPISVNVSDVIPFDAELWQPFKRTNIYDVGEKKIDDIPRLIEENLKASKSLLVICNKKSEAEFIYQNTDIQGVEKFYLSASMCMAHRREMLTNLRQHLSERNKECEEKILCISTQVIEAGVDISFARVLRITAGMDSIIQAAGRCNRNCESAEPAPVGIVQLAGENLSYLKDIERGKKATQDLLKCFKLHPEKFDNDLSSDAAIEYYYRKLYKDMPDGLQDGPVKPENRATTLFSLLSCNNEFLDENVDSSFESYCLRQAFKTAGKQYSVFDNETVDVLVPYKKGRELIADLISMQHYVDFNKLKNITKEAKAYTVSLYEWQRMKLEQQNGLIYLCDGDIVALQEGYYDKNIGFKMEKSSLEFLSL